VSNDWKSDQQPHDKLLVQHGADRVDQFHESGGCAGPDSHGQRLRWRGHAGRVQPQLQGICEAMSRLRTILFGVSLLGWAVQADVIHYWRFEEGSGSTTADEVGGIQGDLIYTPGVQWSEDLPITTIPATGATNNYSLYFGGGSVDITTWQDMNLGSNFTIEFFFNAEQPVISSELFILSNGSTLVGDLSESGGPPYFYEQFNSHIENSSASLVQLNTWQHYALVKNPGEYSIYIDGLLQYNAPLPEGTDGPYVFYGTGMSGSRAIGDGWRGYLDEFRISDEALTPDQFLNAVPEPGTFTLLGLGGLAFLFSKPWKKRCGSVQRLEK